jgi:hypothetical protein
MPAFAREGRVGGSAHATRGAELVGWGLAGEGGRFSARIVCPSIRRSGAARGGAVSRTAENWGED